MTQATCMRGIDWLVAWNADEGRHEYRRGCDLVFEGNTVTFIGDRYDGAPDTEIDGSRLMVMPGLVDIHCHSSNQPLYKGVREDLSNPYFHGSGLYDYTTLFPPTDAGRRAATEYTLCEMLRSGVTTAVDLTGPYDGWIDLLAQSGIRACAAPMFASAQWGVAGPGELRFDWDEQAGRAAFERAVAAIEAAESHSSGRLFGLVAPAEIDTCSAELLRASWDFAQETGRPYQVHTSESIPQFREITQRHGKTPVQWAHDLGILGPGASLGHGIFLDHHAKAHWHTREDLGILAETGTALAHCPTVFSRYGQTLESFGSYRRAGITIGLGTDTFPHNLIEEMRPAIIAGRITDGYAGSVALADAFAAATIGGAGLLLRDDIGRLAPGMKADLVSIDLEHALMRPVRDPLRSLVYTAAERAVRDVYVDGAQVVAEGRVLTLDMDGAAGRLEAEQAVMAAEVPKLDAAGRTAHEVSPLSLPLA